jgi:hypothetical protein
VELFNPFSRSPQSLLLAVADDVREPWAQAWREVLEYVVRQQGSARLAERLVELADSAEDVEVRQAALEALCCLPPDARALGAALRGSQLEALLRKLLLELPEQPSARTSARQRRALQLAALAAVQKCGKGAAGHGAAGGGGGSSSALLLLCVHRCCGWRPSAAICCPWRCGP